MKSFGLMGCGVLAMLSAACGGAEVGSGEGELEVGESTQALNTWSVSFQQGKPVVLCGPSADAPCTTLVANYTGTEDMVAIYQPPNNAVRDDARLDIWTTVDYGVAYVKWNISALQGRLPAGARLASARVAFKVATSSTDNFLIVPGQGSWTERFPPTVNPALNANESFGLLAPRWQGAPEEAPREIIATATLFDFEPYFKKWLDTPQLNYGVWIGHPGGPGQRASLHSSEGAVPPKLLLTFRQ